MKAITFSINTDASVLDQWDFGLVRDLLNDLDVEWTEDPKHLPKEDRAIVLIPARHNANCIDIINKELANIDHIILFLLGDEEADFPVGDIAHKDCVIYVQNPHLDKHDEYNRIGTGYPQHLTKIAKAIVQPIKKTTDIFFAGQITHQRRQELIEVLSDLTDYDVNMKPSKGFTQGISPLDYTMAMTGAKIAPAPSGAVIPDSFRAFEALECMSLLIADEKTASGEIMNYWDWLFDETTPFDKVVDWDRLYSLVPLALKDYDNLVIKQTEWYLQWKRKLKWKIQEQYYG